MIKKLNKETLIGIGLALCVASLAFLLGGVITFVGKSILALVIGMVIGALFKSKDKYVTGYKFTSKKLLKLAIILLGFNLSVSQILIIGKYSLFVMMFTLVAGYLFGYLIGKALKIDWRLSSLISSGTCICGGSAIATIAPIIDADDSQIAYAISATFLFDMLMIILFPIMGNALGMSDLSFGLWAGTAVNDTSSVVATAYSYSEAAGDFATIVKLTRTTMIVPIALVFTFIAAYKGKKAASENASDCSIDNKKAFSFKKVFPWFILLFLVASMFNSFIEIPAQIASSLKTVSKFMMCMALGAIGLNTDFSKLKKAGLSPMFLGFSISLIVVVVALLAQMLIGQF